MGMMIMDAWVDGWMNGRREASEWSDGRMDWVLVFFIFSVFSFFLFLVILLDIEGVCLHSSHRDRLTEVP